MWLYFNKKGQLVTSLEHGSPARVGTTDFSIFAVFEGIEDQTALESIAGATIKLKRPDLTGSEYPTLLMQMAITKFELTPKEKKESVKPFIPNHTYYGFFFDFGAFNSNQQEEILLDTEGLWCAIITLIAENYNVQGVATFNVDGVGRPDPTHIAYDTVVNQLMKEIGERALKSQVIIEIPNTEADVSNYKEGQLFFCREDKKIYVLVKHEVESEEEDEESEEEPITQFVLELEVLAYFQDKLESGINIKTINGESILGEGNIVVGGGSANIDNKTIVLNDNNQISLNQILNANYLIVDTVAQRDAIPRELLKKGTLVKIDSTGIVYRWNLINWENTPVNITALGDGLKLSEDGVLSVDTIDEAINKNKQPITSNGVYNILGDINLILERI